MARPHLFSTCIFFALVVLTIDAANSAGGVADDVAGLIIDGNSQNDLLGWSVSSAGDFNGDGIEDLIIGARNYHDDNGLGVGRAFVFLGPSSLTSPIDANQDADIVLLGPNDQATNFGISVASIGDFNGDGRDDVIVGAFFRDSEVLVDAGSAYIFLGCASPCPPIIEAANADVIIHNLHASIQRFGISASSAGDFNSDGLDDVIVGTNDTVSTAHIFLGRNSATPLILSAFDDADILLSYDAAPTNSLFGKTVATAGDFDNDGFDDVIVGAERDDDRTGAAFIFRGRAIDALNPLELEATSDADVVIRPDHATGQFGRSVSGAGDVNADGFGDIFVGSPIDGSDSAYLFLGRPLNGQISLNAERDAHVTFLGEDSGDLFGLQAANVGDVNNDGSTDLAVGTNNTGSGNGSVYIFLGDHSCESTILADHAEIVVTGTDPGDQFGSAVAAAGDFNDDGVGDVVAGAPRDDPAPSGRNDAGRAFVLLGENGVHQLRVTACPTGEPNPVGTGQDVSVSVGVEDNLGHVAAFSWTSDCSSWSVDNGAFLDAGAQATTWRAPDNPEGPPQPCKLAVAVDDGAGGLGKEVRFTQWVDSTPAGPGVLDVFPVGDAHFQGPPGGPFVQKGPILLPAEVSYRIENVGGEAIDLLIERAPAAADWVSLTGLGCFLGVACIPTLQPGQQGFITIAANSNANPLPVGEYESVIEFKNLTNGSGDATRTVHLSVDSTDTIPPIVTPPPDVTIEAEGPTTEIADKLGQATAIDNVDGVIEALPYFGGITPPGAFGLGELNVEWRATDAAGNTGNAFQKVTIVDTTPPQLSVPDVQEIFVTSLRPFLELSDFGEPTVSDLVDPNPDVRVLLFPDDGQFELGPFSLIWVAEDASGNVTIKVQTVVILLQVAELAAVEVVQTLGSLFDDITLIRDKTTHFRAYFRTGISSARLVRPRLRAFSQGTELPGGPLLPVNPGGYVFARRDILNRRATFMHPEDLRPLAANFLLPKEWTRDNVRYRIEFEKSEYELIPCENAVGHVTADCTTQPYVFGHAPTFDVRLVRINHWTEATPSVLLGLDCDGRFVGPRTIDTQNIVRRLMATLPINKVVWTVGDSYYDCEFGEPWFETINFDLVRRKTAELCPTSLCNTLYYGVAPVEHTEGGLRTDFGFDQTASGAVRDDARSLGAGNNYFRNVAVHELAHSLEIPHPYWKTLTHDIFYELDPSTDEDDVEFDEGDEIGPCGADSNAAEGLFPFYTLSPPRVPLSVFDPDRDGSFNVGIFPFRAGDGEVPGGQVASIGPMNQGDNRIIIGYDSSRDRYISPLTNFELMSYCGPAFKWPSTITYERLFARICDQFEGPCFFPPAATATIDTIKNQSATGSGGRVALDSDGWSQVEHDGDEFEIHHLDTPAPFTMVQGLVIYPSGAVDLNPVWNIDELAVEIVPPQDGDYEVQLFDQFGNSLGVFPFDPHFELIDPTRERRNAPFLVPVPKNENLSEIRVMRGQEVMATAAASPNAPTVKILAPNGDERISGDTLTVRWNGRDKDGDELRYNVEMSTDGGISWRSLAFNYRFESLDLDVRSIGASQQGLVRVQVMDGFHTATDTSDRFFTTPNSAPEVIVLTPHPHDVFFGDQLLVFKALSQDLEDGPLADDNMTWESDLNGFLGVGQDLNVLASTLTPGDHTITASAIDSAGDIGSASVHVRILGAEFPPLVIAHVAVSPDELWPVDRRMVPVQVVVESARLPEVGVPECVIDGIDSDEDGIGRGGGQTEPDYLVTGPLSAELRAERNGTGQGRTYQIYVSCSVEDGEATHVQTAVGVVRVPHDQSN